MESTGRIVDGDQDTLTQSLWSGVHGVLTLPVNMDRLDLAPAAKLVG